MYTPEEIQELQTRLNELERLRSDAAIARNSVRERVVILEKNLRAAWEAGFALCRAYGADHFDFAGNRKERAWANFLETLT